MTLDEGLRIRLVAAASIGVSPRGRQAARLARAALADPTAEAIDRVAAVLTGIGMLDEAAELSALCEAFRDRSRRTGGSLEGA